MPLGVRWWKTSLAWWPCVRTKQLGKGDVERKHEREKALSHYALGKAIKAENPDYSIFELSQRREQGGYLKIKKVEAKPIMIPSFLIKCQSTDIFGKLRRHQSLKILLPCTKSPIDSSLKSSTKSYKKQNFRVRSFGKHSWKCYESVTAGKEEEEAVFCSPKR